MAETDRRNSQQALRTATIIAAAVTATLLVYAFVVEALPIVEPGFSGLLAGSQSIIDILRYGLGGVTLSIAFLVPLLRRRLTSRAPPRESGARPPAQSLLAATVISLALAESPAIFGLVLFLLGGNRWDFYGFAAFAVVLVLLVFPRHNEWQDWIRQQTRPR
jgi:MFS family permease